MQRRKHIQPKAPWVHGPTGLAGRSDGLEGSGPTRWPGSKTKGEFKTDLNFKFERISDFGKTLEICTWKFRRNLDMRIFPKFF
jgi:hypothetical protein